MKVIRIYRQKELAQMERGWAAASAEIGAAQDAILAQHPSDCRIGCNHCCYLRVEVMPPEAARIVDWVREHLPPAERQEILDGIKERAQYADDDPATYRARNLPCVFLGKDGGCRVYPIRPLTCRGFASSNVRVCAGEEPDDGNTTYSATPDELAALVNTSGLFWTEFNTAMLAYWRGEPIKVAVEEGSLIAVQKMQTLCELAERGLLRGPKKTDP